MLRSIVFLFLTLLPVSVTAQEVIPLKNTGGLHSAYVVPRNDFNRVDVQVLVLSGSYDDDQVAGTAHFLEHLAAFSADTYVLRQPRERDLFAKTSAVATIYTNSGHPAEIDRLMKLSRALLDTPKLPEEFLQSEKKIVERETYLRERQYPTRWLRRKALQNLYGSTRGRANDIIADVPKLSLEAALDFHAQHYVPSNVMLIISGNIPPELAAQKVGEYFGDTQASEPPEKWWLDEKPQPGLRKIERLSSNRLYDDTLVYTKFVEYPVEDTSIDLQGEFFIAVSIFESRIRKALIFDSFDFQSINTNFFLAKNGDMEMVSFLVPMPGVSFDTALEIFETKIAGLLDTPPSAQEIETARKRNAAHASSAARRPDDFLAFLENVGSDGLPPISPGSYASLIEDTTDAEVLEFLENLIAPAPMSAIFATKED
ncbi:M16 family metallopeptidase [Neptunicoccus sediminis]|uniref:M16 family metallopeptidase n=1 Tax=Neptunicoccus sediminis TaxID=1892596 RepID=UPI0008462233|nr:insulinase family protein [Neptunicoccus sediminis]